MHRNTKEIK